MAICVAMLSKYQHLISLIRLKEMENDLICLWQHEPAMIPHAASTLTDGHTFGQKSRGRPPTDLQQLHFSGAGMHGNSIEARLVRACCCSSVLCDGCDTGHCYQQLAKWSALLKVDAHLLLNSLVALFTAEVLAQRSFRSR